MFGAATTVVGFSIVLAVGLSLLAFLGRDNDDRELGPLLPGTVVADEFSYQPSRIESGTQVELVLRNSGAVYHDLRIEGVDGFSLTALPGEEDRGQVDLTPGRYVFYCSIPGHRASGMSGSLLVS